MPGETGSARKNDQRYLSRDEFDVFERNVDRQFANLEQLIASLASKMDKVQATDWKTLGMFAGLILTIGALAASPFMRDLQRIEASLAKNSDALASAAASRWTERDQRDYEKGVLSETRRLEGVVATSIKQLDDQLQREMRLLDEALQREMRMLLDAPNANFASMSRLLDEVRAELVRRDEWMGEQDRNQSATNAAHAERLRALENRLRQP